VGRSNRAQAEKNRQRIVDVAGAAFRKSGTRAVTIADVMTQAGMTQGGFYKHFQSKDALVAEACMSAFNRSAETWKEKGHQPDESVERSLERLIAHYFSKKPPEKTCPMVALAQDAAPHQANQALNAVYQTGVEQLFETFTAIASEGIAPEGQLKEITRERLVLTFAAMVGANMLSRATGDQKWVKCVKQALLDQPSSQPPASLPRASRH
jgi:TetR/AcrR family transcriptional regulator, transcriptional repressor for nem operon